VRDRADNRPHAVAVALALRRGGGLRDNSASRRFARRARAPSGKLG